MKTLQFVPIMALRGRQCIRMYCPQLGRRFVDRNLALRSIRDKVRLPRTAAIGVRRPDRIRATADCPNGQYEIVKRRDRVSRHRFHAVLRPMCHVAIRSGKQITLPRFDLNHLPIGRVHDFVGFFAGVENRIHNRLSNRVTRGGPFLLCAARGPPLRLQALLLKMFRMMGADFRLNSWRSPRAILGSATCRQ